MGISPSSFLDETRVLPLPGPRAPSRGSRAPLLIKPQTHHRTAAEMTSRPFDTSVCRTEARSPLQSRPASSNTEQQLLFPAGKQGRLRCGHVEGTWEAGRGSRWGPGLTLLHFIIHAQQLRHRLDSISESKERMMQTFVMVPQNACGMHACMASRKLTRLMRDSFLGSTTLPLGVSVTKNSVGARRACKGAFTCED